MLFRSATSGGPYASLAAGLGVSNTAFTDLTAVNGMTYYYVVSTVNLAGEGAVSGEASATASSPVSRLSIQSVSNGLMLSWQSGTLQSATNLAGPWDPVTGAAPTSCIVAPDSLLHFFRLK